MGLPQCSSAQVPARTLFYLAKRIFGGTLEVEELRELWRGAAAIGAAKGQAAMRCQGPISAAVQTVLKLGWGPVEIDEWNWPGRCVLRLQSDAPLTIRKAATEAAVQRAWALEQLTRVECDGLGPVAVQPLIQACSHLSARERGMAHLIVARAVWTPTRREQAM
eukprot:10663973-Alexandrium_andersonii.AAC.1